MRMTGLLLMSAILGKRVSDSWMSNGFIVFLALAQIGFQSYSQTSERYARHV